MNLIELDAMEVIELGKHKGCSIRVAMDVLGEAPIRFFQDGNPEPVLLQLDADRPDVSQRAAEVIMSLFCSVISVTPDSGRWFDLEVSLSVPEERTHGVGENPLHIDYVNRSHPPEYIGFLGVRSDPHGGGATILAPLRLAADLLDERYQEILKLPIFTYWTDAEATNVGDSIPKFSVIPDGKGSLDPWVRFTAKMLPHLRQDSPVLVRENEIPEDLVLESLLEYYRRLTEHRLVHRLSAGQFLIFSQQSHAHGRLAMGYGQEMIHPGLRRSIRQIYANRKQ